MTIRADHYSEAGMDLIQRLILKATAAREGGTLSGAYYWRSLQREKPGHYPATFIEGHYSEGGQDLIRRLVSKATTGRDAGTFSRRLLLKAITRREAWYISGDNY